MLINPYASALTNKDLIKVNTVLTAGSFVEVGRYTVPAGTAICIGYGAEQGTDNTIGRIYGDIQKAGPAASDGLLRLVINDPQDRPVEVVKEFRTEQLRTSATDRRQQFPLCEQPQKFGKDYAVVLYYKADAGDTLASASCKLQMDITTFTDRG